MTASHRPITSAIGSAPPAPNVPNARVVMNAWTPNDEKSSTTSTLSSKCGSLTALGMTGQRSLRAAVLDALDVGAQRVQAFVDALVAALDLRDVVDGALALGAERRDQHRHTGTD